MPKFYITEHCNELRVYTYEVEAESLEEATRRYENCELIPDELQGRCKDVLYTEFEILELP